GIADLQPRGGLCHADSYSPDGLGRVGEPAGGPKGVFLACGFNGGAFKMAPWVAQEIVASVQQQLHYPSEIMRKVNLNQLSTRAYNLDFASQALDGIDAGIMACQLGPGQRSEAHNHFENEIFFFTGGEGTISANGDAVHVSAGDAIKFDAFES